MSPYIGVPPCETPYSLTETLLHSYSIPTTYPQRHLAVRFLMEHHRDFIDTLLETIRRGEYAAYTARLAAEAPKLEDEWRAWLAACEVRKDSRVAPYCHSGPDLYQYGYIARVVLGSLNHADDKNLGHRFYDETVTVRAGSTVELRVTASVRIPVEGDALSYLRQLGIPIPHSGNRLGTLRVQVEDSSAVSVVTRTTTVVPEGRAGLAYPGMGENEGFQEAVYLCGLRQNSQDRSNVAFQHMGTEGEIIDIPHPYDEMMATGFSEEKGEFPLRRERGRVLPPGLRSPRRRVPGRLQRTSPNPAEWPASEFPRGSPTRSWP